MIKGLKIVLVIVAVSTSTLWSFGDEPVGTSPEPVSTTMLGAAIVAIINKKKKQA